MKLACLFLGLFLRGILLCERIGAFVPGLLTRIPMRSTFRSLSLVGRLRCPPRRRQGGGSIFSGSLS